MGKGDDPSGPEVPGHLRTGRSEPFGRTKAAGTLQTAWCSPGTKAREAGPIRLGIFVGSSTLLSRLCFSYWIPALPQPSPGTPFPLGALVLLWSLFPPGVPSST